MKGGRGDRKEGRKEGGREDKRKEDEEKKVNEEDEEEVSEKRGKKPQVLDVRDFNAFLGQRSNSTGIVNHHLRVIRVISPGYY